MSARTAAVPFHQRGASLMVVLILLTVMAFGVLSLARRSEASTGIAGNIASKDAALQASEVGLADAYAALAARVAVSPNTDGNIGSWYRDTYDRANDLKNGVDTGIPQFVDWEGAALTKTIVGAYTVRYLVERMCSVSPVTDVNGQCMVKKYYAGNSGKAGTEDLESPPGLQYRATVHVSGPRGAITFVQALFVI